MSVLPTNRLATMVLAFCVTAGCGEGTTSQVELYPVVNFYNWFNDVSPGALAEFTRTAGIEVVHDVDDSDEALEGKLLVGHSNYDLVVPGASSFAKQIAGGLYRALDRGKLHNYRELDPWLMCGNFRIVAWRCSIRRAT